MNDRGSGLADTAAMDGELQLDVRDLTWLELYSEDLAGPTGRLQGRQLDVQVVEQSLPGDGEAAADQADLEAEALQLLQRLVLDLADALARDVERAADLVERAGVLPAQPVAQLEYAALAEPCATRPDRETNFGYPMIVDIADERKAHEDDDECGESHPLLDHGKPCIRFKGHDAYDGQRNHITESGVWW